MNFETFLLFALGKDDNPKTVLKRASRLIRTRYNIYEMTIQVEEYNDDMIDCNKCQDPL